MIPHHRCTLPPTQAIIVLKSAFLNNITHYLWLSCDSLHFGYQKFHDLLQFFFPVIYYPSPVYLSPDSHSEENDSPKFFNIFYWLCYWNAETITYLVIQKDNFERSKGKSSKKVTELHTMHCIFCNSDWTY